MPLSRKEPTWVLVSDDKPEYLEQGALVLCDHELLQRQMKRMRPDLRLERMEETVKRLKAEATVAELDEEDIWPWVEDQRLQGNLDGFIVPRAIHAGHRMKGRRHTLGRQRDRTENNRERFIPPPLYGFTLLVSRKGFPKDNVRNMLDPSAELAYRLEAWLVESIDPKLRPIIGAYIEQRKISTLLKKAGEEGDETLLDTLVNPNKNRAAYKSGPRVEMLIETLTSDGTVTAACERIVQPANSQMGLVTLLKEFMDLLNVMTTDHEATRRNIPGMPDSFMEPRPRLMDSDEYLRLRLAEDLQEQASSSPFDSEDIYAFNAAKPVEVRYKWTRRRCWVNFTKPVLTRSKPSLNNMKFPKPGPLKPFVLV